MTKGAPAQARAVAITCLCSGLTHSFRTPFPPWAGNKDLKRALKAAKKKAKAAGDSGDGADAAALAQNLQETKEKSKRLQELYKAKAWDSCTL